MKVYYLEDFIKETEKDLPFCHKRLAKIKRKDVDKNIFRAVRVEQEKFLYDELKKAKVPKLSKETVFLYDSLEDELIEIAPQENNRVSFRGLDWEFSNLLAQTRYPDEEGIQTIGKNVQVFDQFPNGAFIERKQGDRVFFQDLESFEMIRHRLSFNPKDEKNIFTKSEFLEILEKEYLKDYEIYYIYEELPLLEDGSYHCDMRIILFHDEDLI